MKSPRVGSFVISLDYELFWGQFDKVCTESYSENLIGVHDIVPKILNLFSAFDIEATWAVVGFLCAENIDELRANLPTVVPNYHDSQVSAYNYLSSILKVEDDRFYFGSRLVHQIASTKGQEIASHTFSHYYTKENGQNKIAFEDDVIAMARILEIKGFTRPVSIVFPRNQVEKSYLEVLEKHGFRAYRGVQDNFLYKSKSKSDESRLVRLFRLIDSYINLTGHHTYGVVEPTLPLNLKQSMFLRPYNGKLWFLEVLKIARIKRAMLHAAKNGEIFHLWWHPHNFGKQRDENIKNLLEILSYYAELKMKFGFTSRSMSTLTRVLHDR